ncbi:DUF2268 domain-containing putative Zn-dependent protease [Candidatus Nanohalobium constans]|uniref:DUF2268 domain-containing protein n=1 Tax=Candidatus Nanohalobium constans TaxID=2565781 RepID=A0A5Q0UG62_9ARCH|nr:DUF2268 domain-containing putative Zn-dependent protease [Candidatus Nanohalobium constans]QGA80642.1 hypothetical protein LC1Nh_0758 [Candidatus Nanohalobium constans]
MDIEFFDEEKHDYFLDEYRKYSREPESDEKEFFRSELESIAQDISDITGASTDFKLYFAMTDCSTFDEDAPINRYVHGFSFAEWMEGFERDVVMIRAVRYRENWKDCLINMMAHEMAHQEFYSRNQSAPYTNLENLIFEGHAMNRAEQVSEKIGVNWKPHYRSNQNPDVNSETIINVLDEDRTYQPDNIFQNGEEPCIKAEGYQIAYLIVKLIINEKSYEIDEIPKLADKRNIVEGALSEVLN